MMFTTGSYGIQFPEYSDEIHLSDHMMDKLLGRMMTHTRLVIVPCGYCGCHNAFSNPVCIQCGAPMGKPEHE